MSNLLSRVRQGRSNETSIFDVMYQTGFAGFDFLNGFEVTGYHKDKTKYTYFATGILDGSFNQIIGRSGSGKTTWAIQVAANIITKTSAPFLPVTSAVALFFLSEFFAQGHKYRIDWERGLDEFGSYSPAIVFDEGTMMDGELNYYLQMVEFLTMGIMTSNNESEK